ncbi:MAG: ATP-binding protein [bacterium]
MAHLALGICSCGCRKPTHETRLVAVTGGPGAGKTAVLEMALRTLCPHVAVLPEAASMIFGGGFPREGSPTARAAAQRAIFHVQRELETLVLAEARVGLALCDRGTLDGVAYWPGDAASYWAALGADRATELARYHAVIHLQTPSDSQGYNHQNVVRTESPEEARALDDRIQAAWEGHPRRMVVTSRDDFMEKAIEALRLIGEQVPACCRRPRA